MNQVENSHPQWDPLLLAGLEADEECVEGVGILVRFDSDPGLTDSAHPVRLGVATPTEAQDQLREGSE